MPPSQPFTLALLERAFSPETALSHQTTRLTKPLQIRPTSPTPSARATRRKALTERTHDRKKARKQTPRPLSAAQKRALNLAEIPAAQRKYKLYEPLHELWAGYMREVLGFGAGEGGKGKGGGAGYVSAASGGAMLASADMHGARICVVRSRCISRVGLEGIVVRDTRYTFEIVTRGDVVKSIPKEHTIFRFEVPMLAGEGEETPKPLVFEIFGEQFQTRAPDRANKKFRMHYQPDL